MIAEKQNAHSGAIFSVNFNNDGSQIVSGSSDKTIKVWGALRAQLQAQLPLLTSPLLNTAGAESLAMIAEKQNAHSGYVNSVQFSPNGALIVSGSNDKMIKVWGAGALWASNRPSLAKTDACWLVWQLR